MLLAVEGRDGRLCLCIRTHLDEPETLAAAGVPVVDDFGALHGSVRANNCSRAELSTL